MAEQLRSSPADEIVDDLMPVDLDWRHLVRSYPIPALAVAAAGGFLVGRRHGPALASGLVAFVTREVTRNVESLLGDDEAAGDSED